VSASTDLSQRFERAIVRFELCVSRFEDVIDRFDAVLMKVAVDQSAPQSVAAAATPTATALTPKRRRRAAATGAAAQPKKRRTTRAEVRNQLPRAEDPDSRAERARELRARHENESDNRESEEN
jgi:hypothetical protein